MFKYFIIKLFKSIPVFIIGISLVFFIIHLSPGSPVTKYLSPQISTDVQNQIIKNFGLDQPILHRYFKWIRNIFRFDFGYSLNNGIPVKNIIKVALVPTLLLSFCSLFWGLIFGTLIGIVAALKKNTFTDRIITSFMMFLYSTPSFWIGLLLLSAFAIKLHLFPSSQIISIFHNEFTFFQKIGDYISHLTLPVITMSLSISALFYKYTRTSMIDVMKSDYILAAKARGISHGKIIFKYALRNALLPNISILGLIIPVMFSGTVTIEVIFSLPGLGRTLVHAALARDYPVILGGSILAFIAVIISNIIADILYVVVDPRIHKEN